jgi:fructokinase
MPNSVGGSPGYVVVGDALIDEMHRDGASFEFVGGSALNVAVGLSQLGDRATLLAMIGADHDGAAVRDFLEAHGVRFVPTLGSRGSSRAISFRVRGEPHYEFNEAARSRRIVFGSESAAALSNATFVVVSGFPFDDSEQSDGLMASLTNSRHKLIIDPNPRSGLIHSQAQFVRNLEQIAAQSLLVKIGDDDAALLYESSVEEAASRLISVGASVVLATSGKDGAAIYTAAGITVKEEIVSLPSPIIDTMGAGDATLASIAHSIGVGSVPTTDAAWRVALQEAMKIAAFTCRHDGAILQLS